MNFLAIIPARYDSTRFPGKPLALIGDKPMIQHVYERVSKAIDAVYVATDDDRILSAVTKFGGKAVTTNKKHQSGTDRCYEAYQKIKKQFDVIINVQGDEPFVEPEQIDTIKRCFLDPQTTIATLIKPFTINDSIKDLVSPNIPKVVVNKRMEAIYFSRSVIPFLRGIDRNMWLIKQVFYKHVGMYAYKADTLAQITQLEPTFLEKSERLEQLRWIENGLTIKVGITNLQTISIDTPDDLEIANKLYNGIVTK